MIYLHFMGEIVPWQDQDRKDTDETEEKKPLPVLDLNRIRQDLAARHRLPPRNVHLWHVEDREPSDDQEDIHVTCFIDPHVSIDFAWMSTDNIRSNEFEIFYQPGHWCIKYLQEHCTPTTEWCRFMASDANLFEASEATIRLTYHHLPQPLSHSISVMELMIVSRADALVFAEEYRHVNLSSLESVDRVMRFPAGYLQEKEGNHFIETELQWTIDNGKMGAHGAPPYFVEIELGSAGRVFKHYVPQETFRPEDYTLLIGVRLFREEHLHVELEWN